MAPVDAIGDDVTIDKLLKDLSEAKIDRNVAAGAGNLAAYGLRDPVTLTVAGPSRRESVQVGKESPTGSFAFAPNCGRTSGIRFR